MEEDTGGKSDISELVDKINCMRKEVGLGDSAALNDVAAASAPPSFQSFANKDNSHWASFASVVKESTIKEKVNFRALLGNVSMVGMDVVLSLEDVKKVSSKFNNTLYGYFLGKRLAYPIVENFVKNAWNKYGFTRLMMNGKGFFFFQFDSKRGAERVLEDGPWMIRNIPILLNNWSPSVKLNKEDLKTVPVWVKLHNVPLAAFSEDGLSMLATQVGNPKMLDSFTSDMCRDLWVRSSFARALVEISSERELKEEIVVAIPALDGDGFVKEYVQVEYEWKPPRCVTCSTFGHSNSQCPKIVFGEKPAVSNDEFHVVNNKGKGTAKKGVPIKQNPKVIYRPVNKSSGNQPGAAGGKRPLQADGNNVSATSDARTNSPTDVGGKRGSDKDLGGKKDPPHAANGFCPDSSAGSHTNNNKERTWNNSNPFSYLNIDVTGDDELDDQNIEGTKSEKNVHSEGASTPGPNGLDG